MRITTVIAVTAMSFIGAGAVRAQSLRLDFNSFVADRHEMLTVRFDGAEETLDAGPFSVQVNGGTPFDAYCVDLDHRNTFGTSYQVTASETSLSSLPNAAQIAKLYNSFSEGVDSSAKGAALQVAIWTSVYNSTPGHFQLLQASDDVVANLQRISSTDLSSASSQATFFSAVDHGDSGKANQDVVGGPPAVPEPTSLAMIAMGFVGLGRKRMAGRRQSFS